MHIRGDRDVRYAAIGESRAASKLGHVFDVGRSHDPRIVDADIHEELVQLHILLGVGVKKVMELKTGNRDHRRAIELGVVKAIQEVNSARTRRSEAATQPACILSIGAGHERCRLLMPHLDEANSIGPFP